MIIVATTLLAALLTMKREPLLAGRIELTSRTAGGVGPHDVAARNHRRALCGGVKLDARGAKR